MLHPQGIPTIANNTILNVGRTVGGFSLVIIGMILEQLGVPMVMLFLTSPYMISLITMLNIPNLKKEEYTDSIKVLFNASKAKLTFDKEIISIEEIEEAIQH